MGAAFSGEAFPHSVNAIPKREIELMSSRENLLGTIEELQKIKVENLSVEQRYKIAASIDRSYDELKNTAKELLDSSIDKLENGNPAAISYCHRQCGRINSELKELDELKLRVVDSIERSHIKDGMTKFFRGEKNYVAFQFFVSVLIMFVLALLVYDMAAGEDETRPLFLQSNTIFWIDATCCIIFMSEFFLRLKCANSKSFVWRHHWVDFITSIPIPGGAQIARFGRFARLARFLRFARLLRFMRLFFLLWRGMDKFRDLFDIKLMKKTLKWTILCTAVGAVLVYYLEGVPAEGTGEFGEQVKDLPLAIWWSFTTVLTGGFGDIHNPVTISGQILTGILVIMGMILVGVFTATLTSIFVGEQAEEMEKISLDLGNRIDQLAESVERLKPNNDA
jgi:voltage-gated potassium channel